MTLSQTSSQNKPARILVHRHDFLVRLTHWVNVLCLLVLLMSGLQIFNAHPSLYWGHISTFDTPLLNLDAEQDANGNWLGKTSLFGTSFNTTGILGASAVHAGEAAVPRGFPSWITLPGYQDLSTGRLWHFFFAWIFVINGLAYLLYGLLSRHVWRDLVPSGSQMRHIGSAVWEHLRLHFPRGEEARSYNVLQKLAYLAVIFGLLPLVIFTGLTMSPGMNAAWPWLVEVFGGRQSARTLHFIAAWSIVLFVIVHVVMVVLSGLWNNIRSMITGRYSIELTEKARG